MDKSSQDLEKYSEKFENLFTNQKFAHKHQNELLILIENLSTELELCRRSETTFKNNFNKITDKENANINQKYVFIKEKCKQLEDENKNLIKQNTDLINHTNDELEKQKNDYENKINDIEDKYNFEITNLKNQLESNRICHETKEIELYNELQLAQAASILEWDEKESQLKNQLSEANLNLRLAQSNICKLKFEINQLKNQLALQQTMSQNKNTLYYQETPIQNVKNKIAQKQYLNEFDNKSIDCFNESNSKNETESVDFYNLDDFPKLNEQTLDSSHRTTPIVNQSYDPPKLVVKNIEPLKESTENNPASTPTKTDNNQPSRSDLLNKMYAPKVVKEINKATSIYKKNQSLSDEDFSIDPVKKRPAVHRGGGRMVRNQLPPLLPCSDVGGNEKEKNTKVKKRKLYDPSSYLS